jgi:Mg2+/Co2+ transporter CorB
MGDVPVGGLAILLLLLLCLSAFFSGTETALMSVDRYRLRHLAREGSNAARMMEKLLERPDRLIGTILVCNNFVNTAAAAIVTLIALQLGGEVYAAVGVGVFTVLLIVFGEVAPKTFGALYPERIALPAAVETAAYRIAVEALTNALRHSDGRHCAVQVEVRPDQVRVEVVDDGIGLDPARPPHVGLRSMHERAAEVGGRCAVLTGPQGGTVVRATLPLAGNGRR